MFLKHVLRSLSIGCLLSPVFLVASGSLEQIVINGSPITLEWSKTKDFSKVWQLSKPELIIKAEKQADLLIAFVSGGENSVKSDQIRILEEANPEFFHKLVQLTLPNNRDLLVQALLENNEKMLETIECFYNWSNMPLCIKIGDLVELIRAIILDEQLQIKHEYAQALENQNFKKIIECACAYSINGKEKCVQAALEYLNSIEAFEIVFAATMELLDAKKNQASLDAFTAIMKNSVISNAHEQQIDSPTFGQDEYFAITAKNSQGKVVGFAFFNVIGTTYANVQILQSVENYKELFQTLVFSILQLTETSGSFCCDVELDNELDQAICKELGFVECARNEDYVTFALKEQKETCFC